MSSQITQQKREDFAYRQLQNNLVYISESIIQAIKSGKCEINFWNDTHDIYQSVGLNVDLEKSFLEMEIELNCPNSYLVRLWSKNSSPSEVDKKVWYNKNDPCPGHLVWECCDNDLINEEHWETHNFDIDIQRLIAKYIGTIEKAYLAAGSVNYEIKSLL